MRFSIFSRAYQSQAVHCFDEADEFGVDVGGGEGDLGDDLEYADALTLGRSLVGRQPFRP